MGEEGKGGGGYIMRVKPQAEEMERKRWERGGSDVISHDTF